MCDWILEHSAPRCRSTSRPSIPISACTTATDTPAETLLAAYEIAVTAGLNYAYVGNIQSAQAANDLLPRLQAAADRARGLHDHALRPESQPLPALRRNASPGITIHRRATGAVAGSRCESASSKSAPAANMASPPGRRRTCRFRHHPPPQSSSSPSTSRPMPATTSPRSLPRHACKTVSRSGGRHRSRRSARAGRGDARARNRVDRGRSGRHGRLPVLGAFVSLKREGRLRGCCGFLGQNVPLAKALVHAAQRTANDDHRFPAVAPRELPHLDVEVWLLSNQQLVAAKARRGATRFKSASTACKSPAASLAACFAGRRGR